LSFVKSINEIYINSVLKSCFTLMSASNNFVFNLRSVLEKEKLNGTNFIDLYRNLKIVLRKEKKSMFLSRHILMISLTMQMLLNAELMRSTAITHLTSAV
jgi:hypothetical protein